MLLLLVGGAVGVVVVGAVAAKVATEAGWLNNPNQRYGQQKPTPPRVGYS